MPVSHVKASEHGCGPSCSHYNVVLIGSEIEGIMLAKAAHDEGLSVLILDPREKPGGEFIQGQMQVLDQPNDNHKHSLVQGEIKKLYDDYHSRKIRSNEQFTRYFNQLIQGIPMRSGITMGKLNINAAKQEKSIQSLTYQAKDGLSYNVQADYWVENTDFAALTSKLRVKRIPGLESAFRGKKPEYMAATLMLKFKQVDWNKLHQEVLNNYPLTNVDKKYGPGTYVDWDYGTGFSNLTSQYKPTAPDLMLRGINTTYLSKGKVIMNALLLYEVDPSNPQSVQAAVAKGKKEAPLILKFLRSHIPGYAKAELDGFPDYLYIRDYNRFETEYVLDYEDVMSSKMYWDNVSIGGYAVDLQGTKRVPKGMNLGKPDRYGLPLRSFELKAYDNVLVAGKNVGADGKAYGSARIMPTTALAAQTIGVILGHELKSKRLKELTPADFKRIDAYMRKDYHIKLS
nr:FAD-dependent oxidoreductase [Paenibacillus baekrokdamisoli]